MAHKDGTRGTLVDISDLRHPTHHKVSDLAEAREIIGHLIKRGNIDASKIAQVFIQTTPRRLPYPRCRHCA